MARLLRRDLPDGIYHCTTRAVGRELAFLDEHDCEGFRRLLNRYARRHGWRVLEVCLMGTHYDLLLETTRERLSLGMKDLNGTYARRYNDRHGRRGHLWGDRFAAFVVSTEGRLATAIDYVRNNPVRAGLCARADDWAWSGLAWLRGPLRREGPEPRGARSRSAAAPRRTIPP